MEELNESELGTQEYWDSRYNEELENFEDHGDVGEIWFGKDTVRGTINWMLKNVPKTAKILDIGCGNGMFLIELHKHDYRDLTGVDYSAPGIKLAELNAAQTGAKIQFGTCDATDTIQGEFDVIHDKGTYDAISLNPEITTLREKYLKNAFKALGSNGIFIITSCNWAKDELDAQFQQYFAPNDSIPTPQFEFGGVVGNKVTSVVYKKT